MLRIYAFTAEQLELWQCPDLSNYLGFCEMSTVGKNCIHLTRNEAKLGNRRACYAGHLFQKLADLYGANAFLS